MHKEILVPRPFAGADMNWAKRSIQSVECCRAAETRKTRGWRASIVALGLPNSIPISASPWYAISRGSSPTGSGFALDLAVHAPRISGSDPRNFHAHLLATTREVGTTDLTGEDHIGARTMPNAASWGCRRRSTNCCSCASGGRWSPTRRCATRRSTRGSIIELGGAGHRPGAVSIHPTGRLRDGASRVLERAGGEHP